MDYNLLFRWFVGLSMDDAVWDRTVFSINRGRLLSTRMGREFFQRVLYLAEWQGFVSDEHFSVDGTMIEAWASHKSFVRKDGLLIAFLSLMALTHPIQHLATRPQEDYIQSLLRPE